MLAAEFAGSALAFELAFSVLAAELLCAAFEFDAAAFEFEAAAFEFEFEAAVLVFAAFAFETFALRLALFAELLAAGAPQAKPRAERPRTAESAIAFFIFI
ncbi:MAG: hypothetical protein LC113_00895 [Acidobacteria bacterium]|nr:hypothetical protein [Acidobacteriota bacterium]